MSTRYLIEQGEQIKKVLGRVFDYKPRSLGIDTEDMFKELYSLLNEEDQFSEKEFEEEI